jgi:hypothetical protein
MYKRNGRMIMKNINRIKVVLLFIFGLGNGVFFHLLGGSDWASDFHAGISNGKNPRDDLSERFCRNHYLVREANGDKFIIIDKQGTVMFPPKENIFLPSGELLNGLRCIELPSRLFGRFVKDYSSFWLIRRFFERFVNKKDYFNYCRHCHWMEAYNDGERREIHRQTLRQSPYMYRESDDIPCFVLAQEWQDNDNYVVVDGRGRFVRSMPDGMSMSDLPRVVVSGVIFEKLIEDPVFASTTFFEKIMKALVITNCVTECASED